MTDSVMKDGGGESMEEMARSVRRADGGLLLTPLSRLNAEKREAVARGGGSRDHPSFSGAAGVSSAKAATNKMGWIG